MTPQYTYDCNGNATGVFIPINEWKNIIERFPGIFDSNEPEKGPKKQRLEDANLSSPAA
jgi:hypothetical protein